MTVTQQTITNKIDRFWLFGADRWPGQEISLANTQPWDNFLDGTTFYN